MATLSGGVTPAAASDQRSTAVAFHDCLVRHGIAAALWEADSSNAQVALMAERAVAWNPIDGVWTSFADPEGADMDSVSRQFFDALSQVSGTEAEAQPKLMIAGQDVSEDYAACYTSSGYFAPSLTADPVDELRRKTAVAEASNQWAACARANGHPDIADADAPVADNYATQPEVQIPLTMTADDLRTLLGRCPLATVDSQSGEPMVPNVVPEEPAADAASSPGETIYDRWVELANVLLE
ncbi:MAG: hypothetical protein LBG60_11320 [Bifidobacteriaceae bacterium]|nr:hypothetical protein [Bifidobacteriaceae bacterium]